MMRLMTSAALAASLISVFSSDATAQSKKSSNTVDLKRSMLTGGETRLHQLYVLRPDCSTKIPDTRVVTQPANGTIRFEKVRAVSTLERSAWEKRCLGKQIDAMAVYYTPRNGFVGRERLALDLDTKLGRVMRMSFSIDVRASGATPIAAVDSADLASGPAITRLQKSVFSGNEVRVAAPNLVNADCTSGRVPDVRIASAPRNGEYRLEEVEIPIDRAAGNHRASCNGKPVKAVGVFYKSKPGYTGNDDMLIDADFRNGQVQRYRVEIIVR